MALSVELVSPERILYSGAARVVICRTTEGEIAFLNGHAPFIGALGIGAVTLGLEEGGEEKVAVHGGFVEVRDNKVTLLSDVAELASQIDVPRARAALESSEAAYKQEASQDNDEALRRAKVRLEVAGA